MGRAKPASEIAASLGDYLSEPQLGYQNCAVRNQAGQTLLAIRKVRTDADRAITALLHAEQRLLDSRNCLPASSCDCMIDERTPIVISNHRLRKMLRLLFVKLDLFTLI